MSLINTLIKPFRTTPYHDGKFVPVSEHRLAKRHNDAVNSWRN